MAEFQTIKERIKMFLAAEKISQGAFERKCGFGSGYVANIGKSIGADKIQRIIANYPQINQDWLMFGTGSMLNNINSDDAEYYQDVVDATEEDLENCNNCQYRIPFIPDSYVRSPDVNIRDLIKTNSSDSVWRRRLMGTLVRICFN